MVTQTHKTQWEILGKITENCSLNSITGDKKNSEKEEERKVEKVKRSEKEEKYKATKRERNWEKKYIQKIKENL